MIKNSVPIFIATNAIKSYSHEEEAFPVSLLGISRFKFHKNIKKNFTPRHSNEINIPFKNNGINKFGIPFGITLANRDFCSYTNLNTKFSKRDTKNNNLFKREFY
jgi:hypothetical protein